MKYIYDILLNFNEELYDYYEWKESDYIEYVKKIPLVKVKTEDYRKIRDYKVVVPQEVLDKIYNTTEVYVDKTVKLIEYACVFTNGEEVIAVEFNYRGFSIMKSNLLIDESDEIIEISDKLKEVELKYEVISKEESNKFITRNESEKLMFLNREIKMLYRDKNGDKLKYLYYECFNKRENDIEVIYNLFMSFISKEWDEKHNKLYELLKLAYIKK